MKVTLYFCNIGDGIAVKGIRGKDRKSDERAVVSFLADDFRDGEAIINGTAHGAASIEGLLKDSHLPYTVIDREAAIRLGLAVD